MKKIMVLSMLFFVSCSDSFMDEFNKSYEENFRKSFRNSFIKSCTTKNISKEVCSCIADDTLENLSVQEIKDVDIATEYVKRVSKEKCITKFDFE